MIEFQTVVKQVESLPPLSDSAQKIRKIFNVEDEDINIIELVRAIEADASLSANILKMVNAPFYGFSKQITSISHAVTLFGTRMVYGMVMRFAVEKAVIANLRPYGINAMQLNKISHLQSRLVMQWYSKIDINLAQDIASLALMMESGKLVVAKEVAKAGEIKTFLDTLNKSATELEHELATFSSSSYFIAGLLFEHWNFDPLYSAALKGLDFEISFDHPYFQNYIEVLDIARHAVNIRECLTPNSIETACEVVEEYGMDRDKFVDVAHKIQRHIKGV